MEATAASDAATLSVVGSERQSPRDGLADWSPRDAPWDAHKAASDQVAQIYHHHRDTQPLAARIRDCARVLRYAWSAHEATGEIALRLREARFCRARYCPVCQWRRSLMWKARMWKALPGILAKFPNGRWIFLTLTIRNCPVEQLGATLDQLNAAWHRLLKRREFEPVLGWIRSTEVTRSSAGEAHPHFHALLLVPQTMLSGRNYVTHAQWVKIWRECLRVDYDPVVNVKAIQPHKFQSGTLPGAIVEVLKYSVKPSDMVSDPAWFHALTEQTYHRRFIATGGVLRGVISDPKSDSEMIHVDEDQSAPEEGSRLAFGWNKTDKRYRRRTDLDR